MTETFRPRDTIFPYDEDDEDVYMVAMPPKPGSGALHWLSTKNDVTSEARLEVTLNADVLV